MKTLEEIFLFDRVQWAHKNLEPVEPSYRVVFEVDPDSAACVLIPSPQWMAMALHGGLLPPVDVYHQLECYSVYWLMQNPGTPKAKKLDELKECGKLTHSLARLDELNKSLSTEALDKNIRWCFAGHWVTNGHILHDTPTVGPMTEEQAIEYLIQKDLPREIWEDTSSNRPRFVICNKSQIPSDRSFRNAWSLAA